MSGPPTRLGGATIVPLVAAALLAVFLAGCGGGGAPADRPTSQTAAKASLTDLTSVQDFAARFNEKRGVLRLVLLLSPT